MNNHKKAIKRFFKIDFIYIEGMIVAGLSIAIGIIGVVFYFIDNMEDSQYLTGGIFLIIVGIIIFVLRKKLKDFMV